MWEEFEETSESGNVKSSTYFTYLTSGWGYFGLFLICFLVILSQSSLVLMNFWLSNWYRLLKVLIYLVVITPIRFKIDHILIRSSYEMLKSRDHSKIDRLFWFKTYSSKYNWHHLNILYIINIK